VTGPQADGPALEALVARAEALATPGRRRILGIAGPPGAGKSTLGHAVCEALDGRAVLVPMDGFHRSNEELVTLGLRDRKGAPETFDATSFVELLGALRSGAAVLAPDFDREQDRVVPDAIPVAADVPLVVVEGNYLLLEKGAWAAVRDLLDEAWYLVGDDRRVERLIARHVAHGRTPEAARAWVLRSDEANARRIAPTEARADLVIRGFVGR
jgi:pantothenate kinase